jgi:hypothetical protein
MVTIAPPNATLLHVGMKAWRIVAVADVMGRSSRKVAESGALLPIFLPVFDNASGGL